jgi:O-antigen/teichoic acid export membrane protein
VGIYSQLSAYLIFALVFFDGQLSTLLIRICGGKGNRFVLALKSVVSQRANALAFGVLLVFIGFFIQSEFICLYIMMTVISLLSVADTTLLSYLRVQLRNSLANLINGLNGILRLLGVFVVTSIYELNILFFVIGLLIAKFIYFIVVFWLVFPKLKKEKKTSKTAVSLLDGIEQRSFMVASGISAIENRIDWFIIGLLIGPKQLAVYALANKVFEFSKMVIGIGMTNIFPHLSYKNNAGGFYIGIITVSILIAISLIFSATAIENHFGVDKYAGVANVIILFMMASPLSVCVGFIYQQAILINRYQIFLLTSILAISIQTLLNFLYIPVYGLIVGPLAMGASWIFMILMALFYVPSISKLQSGAVIGICALLSAFFMRSI